RAAPLRFNPGPAKSYAAIASNDRALRQVVNFGIEIAEAGPLGYCRHSRMSRSGCANGSGCRSTALTTEKIAALAPIPSASAAIATTLKRGFLSATRIAWRRSARGVMDEVYGSWTC